ncbi:MAG: mechanosensitive ion channel domain-containing protein, partial [Candidatus Nanohaloarchaea archaeon]
VKGDYVHTEKVEGVVRDIKLRETEIRAPTGEKIVVPNSYLSNNPVQNRTKGRITVDTFTVNVPMAAAHDAEDLYHGVVDGMDNVLDEPAPVVYFSDISDDDEVVMHFRYAVRDSDNTMEARDRILRRFTGELVENGIIPEAAADAAE